MIVNNNSALSNELRDVLKLQAGRDQFPQLAENKIVPVIDVNPKHARVAGVVVSQVKSTTGTQTMMTTATNKDFYITGATFSFIKDATCDIASGSISLYTQIDGAGGLAFITFPVLTTTAQSGYLSLSFTTPIKVDRGVAISFNGTFTAGAMVRAASIIGYYVDNINA